MWVTGNIIARDLKLHESPVSRLYMKLKKIILWKIARNKDILIGGQDCIVEIDENLFIKRKFHQGRVLANQNRWLLV